MIAEPPANMPAFTIVVAKGNLASLADQAEAALLKNCPLVFQRAGQIVEIVPGNSCAYASLACNKTAIKAVGKYRLIDILSVAARWEKAAVESSGARIDPPDKVADAYSGERDRRFRCQRDR